MTVFLVKHGSFMFFLKSEALIIYKKKVSYDTGYSLTSELLQNMIMERVKFPGKIPKFNTRRYHTILRLAAPEWRCFVLIFHSSNAFATYQAPEKDSYVHSRDATHSMIQLVEFAESYHLLQQKHFSPVSHDTTHFPFGYIAEYNC